MVDVAWGRARPDRTAGQVQLDEVARGLRDGWLQGTMRMSVPLSDQIST
ncbi:hypothetical protein [Streptomyces sp. CFMR 7]|nr:hypothetical protein [Streptomyces sp. CFMR 7]